MYKNMFHRTSTVAVLTLFFIGLISLDLWGLFDSNGCRTEILQSEKPRETSPEVEPTELGELVAGNSAFAFGLFQALRDGEGNLFYSPYSISLALAMTYAGARGETERQMGETFHFTLPQDRLHPAFNALDLELASRGEGTAGEDEGRFRLNIANAI